MTQTWQHLLFAHWPIAAGDLRPLVPQPLELDTFDGTAWLGIVPFEMQNVGPRGVPRVPGVSRFPELNVRTYVRAHGTPGVYFFSLDAASRAAVITARTLFSLPYYLARMRIRRDGDTIHYVSRRYGRTPAAFAGRYRGTGDWFEPAPGTLEYFLTERYCLWTVDGARRAVQVDIHHPPWRLRTAAAEIDDNTMAAAAGIRLPARPPLLHVADRQDVVAWLPRRRASRA
jgi:hypothetical protein